MTSTKTDYSAIPYARLSENQMATFASHCASIMSERVDLGHTIDSPKSIGYAVGSSFYVEIKFHHRGSHFGSETVWDGTTINGKSCGNRHGAVAEFTRLVFKHFEFHV